MLIANVKKINSFKENIFGRHFLSWLLVITYFALFNSMDCSESSVIIFGCLFSLSFLFSYYFLYFFIFPFALRKKILIVIFGYLISYCIFISVDLINFNYIFPFVKIMAHRNLSDLSNFIKLSSFWYAFLLIVSYANMISLINYNNVKIINQKTIHTLIIIF
jgi:hypothetical protein